MIRLVLGGAASTPSRPASSPTPTSSSCSSADDVDVAALPQPLTLDSFNDLPAEQQPVVRTYTVRRADADRARDRHRLRRARRARRRRTVGRDGAARAAGLPDGSQRRLRPGPGRRLAPAGRRRGRAARDQRRAWRRCRANAIGQVFIEVAGPDDEIPLTAPEGVEINWIYRGGRADLVPRTGPATTRR